jgi:hypothetical protein
MATNECACGYPGDPRHECRCTPARIQRYRARMMLGRRLSEDRCLIELWPGDKRRPYTPFGVSQRHL